jgi:hypothetical protein
MVKGGEVQLQLRWRFWLELLLASAIGLLGLVTLVWRDWIEAVFGFDPDRHSGSVEWLIVFGLLAAASTLGVAARAEWRRATVPAPARR